MGLLTIVPIRWLVYNTIDVAINNTINISLYLPMNFQNQRASDYFLFNNQLSAVGGGVLPWNTGLFSNQVWVSVDNQTLIHRPIKMTAPLLPTQ